MKLYIVFRLKKGIVVAEHAVVAESRSEAIEMVQGKLDGVFQIQNTYELDQPKLLWSIVRNMESGEAYGGKSED